MIYLYIIFRACLSCAPQQEVVLFDTMSECFQAAAYIGSDPRVISTWCERH